MLIPHNHINYHYCVMLNNSTCKSSISKIQQKAYNIITAMIIMK